MYVRRCIPAPYIPTDTVYIQFSYKFTLMQLLMGNTDTYILQATHIKDLTCLIFVHITYILGVIGDSTEDSYFYHTIKATPLDYPTNTSKED